MEKEDWLLQELERIYNSSHDYQQQALLEAAKKIIHEQTKRIQQMEGELDGTLWSPRKWGE